LSARRQPRLSPSAIALLVVAVLATVQFVLLAVMIGAQRDGAHIIDITGAQRMRSQRIAYLVTAAHDGTAPPAWRAELLEAVREMRSVRLQMTLRALTRTARSGPGTPLAGTFDTYLQAAETAARNPNDGAALREIRRDRLKLLAASSTAVQVRTGRIQHQNDVLLEAFAIALALLIAAIFAAWRLIVVPSELRTADATAALLDSQLQFRSLFGENPEAIAMYDLAGNVVRGNRAAIRLMGKSANLLVGAHFSQHLAPASLEGATAAFAEAASGRNASFEATFKDADGEAIEVSTSLFPTIVKQKVTGVFGIARDLRDLKRVQASYKQQADRMSALYKVAAGTAGTRSEQISEALSVACAELSCDAAFLAEVALGAAAVVATTAQSEPFLDGFRAPLLGERQERADDSPESSAVEALARAAWPDDAARQARFAGSVIASPIVRAGTWFGTLGLIGRDEKKGPLSNADRDFLGLVCALIGSALERGQQEDKLDALAFFDALTELPNRVLLNDRMAELIVSANRTGVPFAVHFIDLDRFKPINDSFGHSVGDRVLQIAARRMESVLRATDTVARIGGDEFVVLQPGAQDRRLAQDVAERILESLSNPFVVEGISHGLGASIGISLYPADGRDGQTLLQRADDALYRAKAAGRNQLKFAA
jgi:diguanylate cyclase (GGDEF)-like protein/PAS domain S-box-containing protein